MFEKRKAEKAAREHGAALASWTQQRDGYAHLVDVAQNFGGSTTTEIMLKPGEALFYKVSNTALVEERAGKGHYQGASAGVSIPIGSVHGRSVRYRVGATRGHYVQGAPVQAAVDTGTTYITNQRVVFQGAKQTRECLFAKLIGASHDDSAGETTISVSNRQKPTTIHYGAALSDNFNFRLELAVANFKGTVPELVDQMRQQLAQIDAERPGGPAVAPSSSVPPASPPSPAIAPVPAAPLATPSASDIIPPPDHEAGWEYLYLASELARGLSVYQGPYAQYQSQVADPSGDHIGDPTGTIKTLTTEISGVVSSAMKVLSAESLERAFGAPGTSGDEAAIRDVALQLATAYGELISWGIKVRSANVDPSWRPAFLALSKYVSLPLHQFQDFSAGLSAVVGRVVADVRAGKAPSEQIELTLALSIDPSATAEFDGALAALRATK